MNPIRMIVLSMLVLFVAACRPATAPAAAPAPAFTEEDKVVLRGMIEKFAAHTREGNWGAYLDYYAPDAVRLPPDSDVVLGETAILARMETMPPVGAFTIRVEDIAGSGNLAHARGGYSLYLTPPDAEPVNVIGYWQAVYERQADGSWLCVNDIWNRDQRERG